MSCASAGNCSAVGEYIDDEGNFQGLLLSETGSTWRSAVKALVPVGARSDHVIFSAVSCASAGNCSAVGEYTDAAGNFQGLLVDESRGGWRRGVKATLPGDAGSSPDVILDSVSCASAGNCSAVGAYTDDAGNLQGLLLTEIRGKWAVGLQAGLPADAYDPASATPQFGLYSVSCASAGNCSAVGQDEDAGLLFTETRGKWAAGQDVTLPPNAAYDPTARVLSVSCASAGNCSAVGDYLTSSGAYEPLLVSEGGGTWAAGSEAATPANGESSILSVSCASAGDCSAVGEYEPPLALTNSDSYADVLSESGGVWAPAATVTLPADAGSNPGPVLGSVSCASVGNCGAVGGYIDDAGHYQGLVLSETRGAWAPGVEVTLPAGGAFNAAYGPPDDVSCVSVGSCTAVGTYTDAAGDEQGLLLGGIVGSAGGSAAGTLVAYPLEVRQGATVNAAIGFVTAPKRSKPRATVRWGDGRSSSARVVAAPAGVDQALVSTRGYLVRASHRYDGTRATVFSIVARFGPGREVRVTAPVVVDPIDPRAYFVINPSDPRQNGLGFLIPKAPAPDQERIVAWRWTFGDGNPVLDNASTRPVYMRVLRKLRQEPSNPFLRAQATVLGILPTDQQGGPLGLGALPGDEVEQLANVWLRYFPEHIVPHLWDYYGDAGVALRIQDSRGIRSDYVVPDVHIARDCEPWKGPLALLFLGHDVCDTANGISDLVGGLAAQFGPHRPPDYKTLELSNGGCSASAGLGYGAGVTLLGASAATSSVFLTVHASVGLGCSLAVTGGLSFGWVGRPDPADTPSPDTVASLVNGRVYSGGFTLGIGFVGLGFNAVYSPSSGLAGEELQAGALGIGAASGMSCSIPLSNLDPSASASWQRVFTELGSPSSPPSARQIQAAKRDAIADLRRDAIDPLTYVKFAAQILPHCG